MKVSLLTPLVMAAGLGKASASTAWQFAAGNQVVYIASTVPVAGVLLPVALIACIVTLQWPNPRILCYRQPYEDFIRWNSQRICSIYYTTIRLGTLCLLAALFLGLIGDRVLSISVIPFVITFAPLCILFCCTHCMLVSKMQRHGTPDYLNEEMMWALPQASPQSLVFRVGTRANNQVTPVIEIPMAVAELGNRSATESSLHSRDFLSAPEQEARHAVGVPIPTAPAVCLPPILMHSDAGTSQGAAAERATGPSETDVHKQQFHLRFSNGAWSLSPCDAAPVSHTPASDGSGPVLTSSAVHQPASRSTEVASEPSISTLTPSTGPSLAFQGLGSQHTVAAGDSSNTGQSQSPSGSTAPIAATPAPDTISLVILQGSKQRHIQVMLQLPEGPPAPSQPPTQLQASSNPDNMHHPSVAHLQSHGLPLPSTVASSAEPVPEEPDAPALQHLDSSAQHEARTVAAGAAVTPAESQVIILQLPLVLQPPLPGLPSAPIASVATGQHSTPQPEFMLSPHNHHRQGVVRSSASPAQLGQQSPVGFAAHIRNPDDTARVLAFGPDDPQSAAASDTASLPVQHGDQDSEQAWSPRASGSLAARPVQQAAHMLSAEGVAHRQLHGRGPTRSVELPGRII